MNAIKGSLTAPQELVLRWLLWYSKEIIFITVAEDNGAQGIHSPFTINNKLDLCKFGGENNRFIRNQGMLKS